MIKNLLVVLFVLPFASAGEKKTQLKDGIYYLQKDDFDTITGPKNFAIFFHSPWTDSSSKVLFEFQKAAELLSSEDVDMNFGVVDIGEDDYTAHRFGINGGPVIKMFHDYKPYEFTGNFTYVSILETVRSHAKPGWIAPTPKASVLELKSVAEFEAHIKKHKLTLVKFYAPWCNHCQQLEPVMVEVAEELSKVEPPIPVARINAEEHHQLYTRFELKGYPYLLAFKNGKHTTFEGPKNVKVIVDFIKSRMSITSVDLPAKVGSAFSFGDTKKSTVVVGYFSSRTAYEFTVFSDVAESFRNDKDIHFAHVISNDAVSVAQGEFGFHNDDYGIVVIRDRRLPVKKGTQRFSVFAEDPIDKDSIKKFINDNRHSLVSYAPSNPSFRNLFGGMDNISVVFMDIDWDQDTLVTMSYRLNLVAQVAEKFPDVQFVAVDHNELHELKDHMGLGENDHDMSAAIFHGFKLRYPLDGECNVESLTQHVSAYVNGEKLAPHFMSQAPPKVNNGPIKTLVRSTYDEVMGGTTHDVVVLFTTTWSQESKKFLPVLRKAHGLMKADSVEFYKYDISHNDLPSKISVEKPPTLLLFPVGGRESSISTYSGPRNSKSIVSFITENAATLQTPEDEEENEGHSEL